MSLGCGSKNGIQWGVDAVIGRGSWIVRAILWFWTPAWFAIVGMFCVEALDPANWDVDRENRVEWVIREIAFLLSPWTKVGLAVASVTIFTCEWADRRHAGNSVWETIDAALNHYRSLGFKHAALSDPDHHHRVTLFKRIDGSDIACWTNIFRFRFWKFRWVRFGRLWIPSWAERSPFSGWIFPVARSCETTRKTKTAFFAPDAPHLAEGIAGRVWAGKTKEKVLDFPQLTADSTDQEVQDYCRTTGSPEAWVRKCLEDGRTPPRSLYGVPIMVRGRTWGAIVFDSQQPDGIKATEADKVHDCVTSLIGKLLEETTG